MNLLSRHYFAWLRWFRAAPGLAVQRLPHIPPTPTDPPDEESVDARYAALAIGVAEAGTWRLDGCYGSVSADADLPWDTLQFVHASPRALDLWGQPPLPPGQRCALHAWRHALLAANDMTTATMALAALEKAMHQGVGYDVTYAYVRPSDRRQVWLRDVAQVLRDHHGQPLALLGITTDVSQRRNAEAGLLHSQLLNDRATQMKSEFLGRTSHAIRTPMNAIIGLSHLALKTELTARQRDYLRRIEHSGQQLLGIINNILDISQLESGQLAVTAADFELSTVLERVVTQHGSPANDKGIELIITVDQAIPGVVRGDALRLEQLLTIYVTNAIRFTQHGEIRIAIYPEREDGDWLWLRFDVRDTGIGIPADQQSRLFLPLASSDPAATVQNGTGAGLSLVIAKRLAELMHGNVGVESTPGHGAYFWFTARLDRAQTMPSPRLPQPTLRGKRVLVVDDNEHARLVLVDMLNDMGLQTDAAEGGYAALEAVRSAHQAKQPFELVFLDWHMPDLNGIEVAHRLCALDLTPAPRLVMVTAFTRQDVLETAQNAGIDDVLVKPVTASALLNAATRSFRSESAETVRAAAPGPNELPQQVAFDAMHVDDATCTPNTAPPSAWPPVPIAGLDTSTGLQRVLGRKNTYLRLLKLFVQQEKWTCQTLHSVLDRQQVQTVQRIAHSTRICAANIGAETIEELAHAIERAVEHHASVEQLRALVNQLQPALDTLLTALAQLLSSAAEPLTETATDDGDTLALPAAIEALLRLLHNDDVTAGDLFERYAAPLQATFAASFSELETAITQFDYRRGERLLQHALATTQEKSSVYKGSSDAHLSRWQQGHHSDR